MKQCSKCGELKTEAEYYYNAKSSKLFAACRKCSNAYAKQYQTTNRDKRNAYSAKWRAGNQERFKRMKFASNRVATAIKQGVLVRATICEACAKPGRIEAAHVDYGKSLDVKWLCVSCHRLWDSTNPKSMHVVPLHQ